MLKRTCVSTRNLAQVYCSVTQHVQDLQWAVQGLLRHCGPISEVGSAARADFWSDVERKVGSAGRHRTGATTRGKRTTHVYAQDYTSTRPQEHVSFIRLLFCGVHVLVISVGCRQLMMNIL